MTHSSTHLKILKINKLTLVRLAKFSKKSTGLYDEKNCTDKNYSLVGGNFSKALSSGKVSIPKKTFAAFLVIFLILFQHPQKKRRVSKRIPCIFLKIFRKIKHHGKRDAAKASTSGRLVQLLALIFCYATTEKAKLGKKIVCAT